MTYKFSLRLLGGTGRQCENTGQACRTISDPDPGHDVLVLTQLPGNQETGELQVLESGFFFTT